MQLSYHADGTTTVTDPKGAARHYTSETHQGVNKVKSIQGGPCPDCGGQAQNHKGMHRWRSAGDLPIKIKWLVILLAAVLLLGIGQYFFLPGWYRESAIKVSGWLIMLSVAAAIALSVWLMRKLSSAASRGSRIGSYLGGYGIYPFALFLGFVVGGNFGGAIGDNALGDAGTVVGIGVGVFVVTIVACSIGALLGFLLGGLTQRLVK
ncbi:MAG: hypothetical protein ACREYE_20305 [Gammaproteobacteria bacterium]